MPPLNTSATVAIELGPLPRNINQDLNGIGPPHEVWYKYTAKPKEFLVSVQAISTGNAWFLFQVYTGPASAPVAYGNVMSTSSFGAFFSSRIQVTPGVTYYFKVYDSFNLGTLTANLDFRTRGVTGTGLPGALLATSDLRVSNAFGTFDQPGTVIDPVTGAVLRYMPLVAGEHGDVLPDGTIALTNNYQSSGPDMRLFLYSPLGTPITSVSIPLNAFTDRNATPVRTNGKDLFYVTTLDPTTAKTVIRAIDAGGVIRRTWNTTTNNTWVGMAPSRDETILYYSLGGTGINRYDLVNNVDLGAWVTISGYTGNGRNDIIVLADETVLVSYISAPHVVTNQIVRHYRPDGTVIRDYATGMPNSGGNPSPSPRIAIGPDDPDSFWVWSSYDGSLPLSNDPISRFLRYSTITGALLTTIDLPDMGVGDYSAQGVNAPFFGTIGQSCPLLVLRQPTSTQPIPTPLSGLAGTVCGVDAIISNGGKGASGCNVGGVGSTPLYDTAGGVGTVPIHPDPIDGEDLTGKIEVDFWVEIRHQDYPSGVISSSRRSFVELSPPDPSTYYGGRKTEGLISIGDFEYALAQEAGTLDIAISDAIDREFRTKLADQDLDGDEVLVYAASPARRAAQLTPLLCYRGVISHASTSEPLQVILQAMDPLFADGGAFQNKWPPLIPADVFTSAPPDTLTLACPTLYGERSDEGAKDPLTLAVTPKGLNPFIYAGRQHISNDSIPEVLPDETYLQDLSIPAPIVDSVTNATAPDADIEGFKATTYIFVAIQRISDGMIGAFTSWGAFDPAGVTEPHGIYTFVHARFLVPTVPDPAYRYIAWTSDDETFHPITNSAVGHRGKTIHDGVTNDFYYRGVPGADTGADFSILVKPNITAITTTTVIPEEWGAMIALLGESYRIIPYGSDLQTGKDIDGKPIAAKRIALTALSSRADILCPWDEFGNLNPLWPYPNTYVTYVDLKGKRWDFTMVFVRGPLLDDHLAGRVTMAFNAIGRLGDNSLPIMTANAARQRWLDDDVLSNYTGGAYVTNTTAPKWADGTYKVRSSAFAAHQAYTQTILGGIGLGVSWYAGGFDGQKAVTEYDNEWNEATEALRGFNNQGQLTVGFIDETKDSSSWPVIDHVTDIYGPVKADYAKNRENRNYGSCDWDSDAGKYRVGPVERTSAVGYARYKNRWATKTIESRILSSVEQLNWIQQKRLTRLQFGEIPVEVVGPIGHLNYQIDGPGILLTTIEGRGASGYIRTPMRLVRKHFSFASRLSNLTLIDGTDFYGRTPMGKGSVSLSGLAPTVVALSGNKVETIPVGLLGFTGRAPSLTFLSVDVPFSAGSVNLTGYAVTTNLVTIAIPRGQLSFVTSITIPTLDFGFKTIAIPKGSVGYTGRTPTPWKLPLLPGVGSLALTGQAPTIIYDNNGFNVIPIPTGSLGVTGKTVAMWTSPIPIPKGSIGLTGLLMFIDGPRTIIPPVGSLSFTGRTPTLLYNFIAMPVGSLGLTGRTPGLQFGIIPIPVGSLGLTGRTPTLVIV